MARLSISDMSLPLPQYRPQHADPCERSGHSFETKAEARAEDLERASRIRAACWATDAPFDREAALALASHLERSGSSRSDAETMASAVYMGLKRICVGGAIWQLVDENEGYNTFTVRPRGWRFTAEELAALDPRRLIRGFRGVVERQRGDRPRGFLIASLHGEFDEVTGLFDVHFHGLACPEMLQVVDELRHLPNFKSRRRQAARVVVGRQALSNPPVSPHL